MTDKHTPGPWTIEPDDWDHDIVVEATHDCQYHPVAKLDHNPSCRTFEEVVANARLIAAAPDLLEALKTVMEALIADLPQAEGGPTVQGALAAIAKAEGRA